MAGDSGHGVRLGGIEQLGGAWCVGEAEGELQSFKGCSNDERCTKADKEEENERFARRTSGFVLAGG